LKSLVNPTVTIEPPSEILDTLDTLCGRLVQPVFDVVGFRVVKRRHGELGPVDPFVDHAAPPDNYAALPLV
jgi:hypothetical protein